MNNNITITIPYYEAPLMLRTQFFQWHKYPEWVWEYLNIIVVDDGSPMKPAEEVFKDVIMPSSSVSLYRIQEDIPWNHGGARNLAFTEMEEGWAGAYVLQPDLPLLPSCGSQPHIHFTSLFRLFCTRYLLTYSRLRTSKKCIMYLL